MGTNTELYTVKDLAERWGISYESTRAFIERHKGELGEHILQPQKGRLRHYDQVALEILERYRHERPVIIKNDSQMERVKELETQLESMKAQYMALQAKLSQTLEKVVSSQEQALQIQSQYHALLTAKEQDAEQMRNQIAEEIRTSARAEVGQEIQKLEEQHKQDLETIQDLRRQLQAAQQHTSPTERNRSPLQALFRRKR